MTKLEQELAELAGWSADVIANRFHGLGVTGERRRIDKCPVTRYLRDRGVRGAWAGLAGCASGDEYVETPTSVYWFMKRFDSGKYPELIAQ